MRHVETVNFAAFTEATREDFELISAHDAENASRNADRAMGWLRSMDGPSPYQVSVSSTASNRPHAPRPMEPTTR